MQSESLLCFHGNRATHGHDETFKGYVYTAMSLQRDTTPVISCLLAWVAELFQKEVYSEIKEFPPRRDECSRDRWVSIQNGKFAEAYIPVHP